MPNISQSIRPVTVDKYCLDESCATFVVPTSQTCTTAFDRFWFPGKDRRISTIDVRPLWLHAFINWVTVFRSSGTVKNDALTLRTDASVMFQSRIPCKDLSALFGTDFSGPVHYSHDAPTSVFPVVNGETFTEPQYQNVPKGTIDKARKSIERLNRFLDALLPGYLGIVVRGIDGFGTDLARVARWLKLRKHRFWFMYLVLFDKVLANNGVGLVQGWLSCGYRLFGFSDQELFDGTSDLIKRFTASCGRK